MSVPEEAAVPVEYLATVRLSEKGQVTLPKTYRDALALDTGASITVLQVGSGLLLIPEHTQFHELCGRIATTLARHGIQTEDLLATLLEARERVVARHYPQLTDQKSSPTRKKRA